MSSKTTVFIYEHGEEEPLHVLEGDNLGHALSEQYSADTFPKGAVIYSGKVIAEEFRLALFDEASKRESALKTGVYSVILYPKEPITIIALVVGVVALVATFLMQPKIPNVATSKNNNEDSSQNNSLAERENQQRIGGLAPEIYGTVRSTPDLLCVPYTIYDGNKAVEYSVMCVGYGKYAINASDIYDDVTPIQSVGGSLIDIFDTTHTVNDPFAVRQLGTDSVHYDDVIWTTFKLNAVNGQLLPASNSSKVESNHRLYFYSDGLSVYSIRASTRSTQGYTFTFSDKFDIGNKITISNASVISLNQTAFRASEGTITFTKSGSTYTITETLNNGSGDETKWFNWRSFSLVNGSTIYIQDTTTSVYSSTTAYTVVGTPSATNPVLTVSGGNTASWPTGTSVAQSAVFYFPTVPRNFNFEGDYEISNVTDGELTLTADSVTASGRLSAWNNLKLFSNDGTSRWYAPWDAGDVPTSLSKTFTRDEMDASIDINNGDATINLKGYRWSNEFIIDPTVSTNNMIINLVAPNGLYTKNSDGQWATTIDFDIEVRPLNTAGNTLTGSVIEQHTVSLTGSDSSTSEQAITFRSNIYQSWWTKGVQNIDHILCVRSDDNAIKFTRSGSTYTIVETSGSFVWSDYFSNGDTFWIFKTEDSVYNSAGLIESDLASIINTLESGGTPTQGGTYTVSSVSGSTLTVTSGNGANWPNSTTSSFQSALFIKASSATQRQMQLARKAILAVWTENVDPSTPLWVTRIVRNDTVSGASRGDQVILATFDGTTYGSWGRSFNNADASSNTYPYKSYRPIWVTVYKETSINSGVIDTSTTEKVHLLIDYRMLPESSASPARAVDLSSTANPRLDYLNLSPNVFLGGGLAKVGVRIRRLTDHINNSTTTMSDECRVKDIYALSAFPEYHFGNVTTVFSKTIATEGALALKKRKLNMLVTRKIRCYNPSGNFINSDGTTYSGSDAPFLATNRIDHIISAVCRDPRLGRRSNSQVDFSGLYHLTDYISNYFAGGDIYTTGGSYPLIVTATQFNYTFDKNDMAFEEMLKSICAVCHMEPHRQGDLITFAFEGAETSSKLLFNHRNKLPNSQTRTVTFGSREDYDGVEIDWTNPASNDALETYKIPSTGTALNALKVEMVGVRSFRQAYRNLWRAWFKMKYQNVIDEFDAMPESGILGKSDRILCADNTRTKVYDGEVSDITSLTLTLSQPVDLSVMINPYIYLQLKDGSVDSISITQGSNLYKVVLSRAPLLSLVTQPESYTRTLYQIWGREDVREKAFLVLEKEEGDLRTNRIKAGNYDDIFYMADKATFWFQPLTQAFIDKTPNARNPIAKGASVTADGSGGRGYTFYNTNASGYTAFDASNPLLLPTNFTITSWIKMNTGLSTGVDFHIFSSTNATSFRFCVSKGASTHSIKAIRGASSDEVCSAELTNPTTWNHVAVVYTVTTYDGSGNPTVGKFTLYLNGVVESTLTGVTHHANNALYFGGNGSTGGFIGRIDGAMVFYDNLTADQIRSFYLHTKGIGDTNKY